MRDAALTDAYTQDLFDRWEIKRGVNPDDYPNISSPFANRTGLLMGANTITFNYTDSIGIDTSSADIKLQKR